MRNPILPMLDLILAVIFDDLQLLYRSCKHGIGPGKSKDATINVIVIIVVTICLLQNEGRKEKGEI